MKSEKNCPTIAVIPGVNQVQHQKHNAGSQCIHGGPLNKNSGLRRYRTFFNFKLQNLTRRIVQAANFLIRQAQAFH